MNIQQIKISDLHFAEYNPRTINKKEFKGLKNSLKTFGLVDPVIVNKDMTIIGGHMRTRAWQELGNDTVPAVVLDLNKKAEKKLNVLLNSQKISGKYDELKLSEILEELKLDDDYSDLNLDELEPLDLSAEVLEAQEDDYEQPDQITTDIVLGDLFEFRKDGKPLHRLLCGDSTSLDDVERLMNGEKADMVFTDPPYKLETDGGENGDIGKSLKKQGRDIEFIAEFNPMEFLQVLPTVFEKNMNAYIFCNNELLPEYLAWVRGVGYSFNVLIWKKPNAIPINSAHRPDIEYLLLFRKSSIWNYGLEGVDYSRCLEYGRERGLHPTMKPIELIANEMKISSNTNSLVLDFFLGSGSTMVASHQLNRRCYGLELDPKYCQVIIDRMKKLDPELEVVKI